MACPAATGAAARLLAGHPVMSLSRDQARSDAMAKLILQGAKSLGFLEAFLSCVVPKPGSAPRSVPNGPPGPGAE